MTPNQYTNKYRPQQGEEGPAQPKGPVAATHQRPDSPVARLRRRNSSQPNACQMSVNMVSLGSS